MATRKFGTTCPICKRFCFLSYVEIDEFASVGELRAKLLQQGWLGELPAATIQRVRVRPTAPGIKPSSLGSRILPFRQQA